MQESLFQARQVQPGDAWRVVADGGMDVLATLHEERDFWLEGVLTLDARLGGLAFRLDDQGGGYLVELIGGASEVTLKKWLPSAQDDGRPWFRYDELQRSRLPRPVAPGEPIPFRLIVVGPYVECSLFDEVVLATLSAERTSGRVGIWAESGAASVTGIEWARMRAPRSA